MFNIPDPLPRITIALADFMVIDRLLNSNAPGGETRIVKYLEGELERADVVALKDLPAHIVTMNSVVTFSDSKTGQTQTAMLVYPDATHADAETVSLLTPIGAALIGVAVGQSITWYKADGGAQTLQVLEVKQPAKTLAHV